MRSLTVLIRSSPVTLMVSSAVFDFLGIKILYYSGGCLLLFCPRGGVDHGFAQPKNDPLRFVPADIGDERDSFGDFKLNSCGRSNNQFIYSSLEFSAGLADIGLGYNPVSQLIGSHYLGTIRFTDMGKFIQELIKYFMNNFGGE